MRFKFVFRAEWPSLPQCLALCLNIIIHSFIPRLLPLCPAVGRGRNFEGFSPPSQTQVGGVLGRHWCVWQSFSADEWTVAVLRNGYRGPSHHLPPVLLEPQELLYCSPGSFRVLVLWEEVDKMLQKGAMQAVDQPRLGFSSHLFLVPEKVTGGWRPVIDLSTLNCFVTLMQFQTETAAFVLGSIRNGDWMFSIDLKDVYFQIPVHLEC